MQTSRWSWCASSRRWVRTTSGLTLRFRSSSQPLISLALVGEEAVVELPRARSPGLRRRRGIAAAAERAPPASRRPGALSTHQYDIELDASTRSSRGSCRRADLDVVGMGAEAKDRKRRRQGAQAEVTSCVASYGPGARSASRRRARRIAGAPRHLALLDHVLEDLAIAAACPSSARSPRACRPSAGSSAISRLNGSSTSSSPSFM